MGDECEMHATGKDIFLTKSPKDLGLLLQRKYVVRKKDRFIEGAM